MDFAAYFAFVRGNCDLLGALSEKEDAASFLLRHQSLGRKLTLRRFAEEKPVYRLLQTVSHPNLPLVYDTVSLTDAFVALEEYIDGITVAQVLETGCYTYRGARRVLTGVGAALQFLHKNGFVHRDVKPENIIVGTDGAVKLIDYDIARAVTAAPRDTRVLGTMGYAPPEQQGLAQSDPRSDIYALGVLLNVMLTREHPSVRLAPGRAGKLVLKCTAVSPEKRFQTVEAFMERL